MPSNADPPPINLTAAAHADVVWRVVPRVEIVPGARLALFDSARPAQVSAASTHTTVPAVDPRLSLRASLTESRSLSERLSGWLTYTLSRSVPESHFLTLDGSEAVATVPSDFDRTHLFNVVLAYDLGRRWRAGARVVTYSGGR